MLTCIACRKNLAGAGPLRRPDGGGDDDDDAGAATPATRQAIKALTAQIKEMVMRASGAYRHCRPCAAAAGRRRYPESEEGMSGSERFCYSYRRAAAGEGSGASTPGPAAPRLGGGSSGEGTPASASGRTEGAASSVCAAVEAAAAEGAREWVAQVEPGVLITFHALPQGGNDLRRIRFSREMFDKWQAQRWWAENYDRVMELYNVQRFSRQAVPLPTPPRSEDESSKRESAEDSPVTPPLGKERLACSYHGPVTSGGMSCSSSDSIEHHPTKAHYHHHHHHQSRHYYDSGGLTSTPKLSSISGAKTETSSMDASVRTSSSPEEEVDRSGELSVSVSNASDQETEWVEQDEPGVYITIRALPGGIRELRRVRFSRERFGEMHARLWWEENRARIHQQYL